MWNNKNSIEDMIIFEDKDILVCHKAAGIAVQNARIGAADMESSLKNYLALKNTETVPYLGVVHRLDQPVEGVLVFAKNKKAAAGLTRQITTGNIVKEYLAVTDRMSEKHQGRLEDYLIKNGRTNTSEVVTSKTSGAKKAVLDYEVIHQISDERTESGKRILIKIHLETGRHHQIRCQLAAMGCPIKGDLKYGAPRSNPDGSISLLARRLEFEHPVSHKQIEVEAPVPADKLWNMLAIMTEAGKERELM